MAETLSREWMEFYFPSRSAIESAVTWNSTMYEATGELERRDIWLV